jgi:hypothetical protein
VGPEETQIAAAGPEESRPEAEDDLEKYVETNSHLEDPD